MASWFWRIAKSPADFYAIKNIAQNISAKIGRLEQANKFTRSFNFIRVFCVEKEYAFLEIAAYEQAISKIR